MKTVLVTSGAGFIGSFLTNYLVDKLKYNVIRADDLSEIAKQAMNSPFQTRDVESRNEVKVAYCSH
jgi:nucleoside-diphosphate-sugar epimerase